MLKCDLHTHSNYSDGTDTPVEIITKAKALGLYAIALTDHNTVAGLEEFTSEAVRQNIKSVAGIEISCEYKGQELHLLGLFIAPEYYERIESVMQRVRFAKDKSNAELVKRLNGAGYNINYPDIKKRLNSENINRSHIAEEMLLKGYIGSVNEAMDTVLSREYGFYIPPPRLQLLDMIGFLRECNALPIIAHPLKDIDETELRALLPDAIEAGLAGIETLHSSYTEDKKALAEHIADEYSLAKSGGSDYHGSKKPLVSLGVGKGDISVPSTFYNKLLELHGSC